MIRFAAEGIECNNRGDPLGLKTAQPALKGECTFGCGERIASSENRLGTPRWLDELTPLDLPSKPANFPRAGSTLPTKIFSHPLTEALRNGVRGFWRKPSRPK